jgi:PAS domain S-box-containing protein
MKAKMEQFPTKNPNPVLSVSKDGTVLYSNEAGEPLLNEWGVRVGDKLPSYIGDLVQRVISRNGPEKIEVKAGKRTYLVAFYPFPDEECVNVYGFDISCQKEFKEKLRESEEKYHDIIETAIEGIWILDDEFRTSYVNKKMAEILGYNQEEMINRFPWEFADKEGINIIKLNMEKRQQGISEILETKYIRSDGSPLWAQVSSKSLFDKSGKFTGVLGMLTDITERKRAEEEVKNASNMLQLIMNNIPQAIFWKDCNSRYLGCNKVFAEDAGFQSPENIVGKTDYDLPWAREQTEWYRECDRRVMKNDTPEYHIYEPQTTADGKLTWLDTNKIPLHDSKGNVIGTLGTYEDITERKEAEESLRLLNLYNRSLIETSLDPLVTIGHDGKILDANNATEQVTGYSRNELIGTDFSDYFTEPEKAKKGYKKVFDEGSVNDYELEIRNKNGKITPVLYNASVYKDESGNVIGVFAAARDITASKKAEEVLKKAHDTLEEKVKERTAELEKAYNSLKESEKGLAEAQIIANIGSWERNLVTGDLYWSNEMYSIFGRNSLEGAPDYNELLNYIHPEDRDYMDKKIKRALNGEPYSTDHRIILHDGEERVVHVHAEVVFDEKNIPVRIRGTVQDITERKKAEEQIQNLANIVESSNDAIGTMSLDGIITSWNKEAEKIYGYSVEEIFGKSISTLAPPHLDKETIKLIEKVKQGKKIQHYETTRLRKDGKIIYVSFTLSPVFNIHGKMTAFSFISRDITERKEAEENLIKMEIARKKEIHHRIKNNLQVISSLLDLQAEQFKNKKCIKDSEVLEAFKESQDRVISMALIHEELYKGEEFETLNFSPYIEELVENLFQTYSLENTDICLKLDLAEDVFFDMDIAVPLGIIVNELVTNSFKHAFSGRDKGEIQIKLSKKENGECVIEDDKSITFTLTVSDNGVGIPEDLKIEDLDSLGLQLVTTLVEQLDGELELQRENGTEFIIRFVVQ